MLFTKLPFGCLRSLLPDGSIALQHFDAVVLAALCLDDVDNLLGDLVAFLLVKGHQEVAHLHHTISLLLV